MVCSSKEARMTGTRGDIEIDEVKLCWMVG
jgi:hypothetical protein